MGGNFQTLPGSGSIDLSQVNAGQVLQKNNFGAIVGTDTPDFSAVDDGDLIKRINNTFEGYKYSALGEQKAITVATVNADQTSIQSAIDAASEGDVVEVQPGIYREALLLKKGVILYLHSGVIVEYTQNNSTPTLQFNGDNWTDETSPFVYDDTQDGPLYKLYVLGEGVFRRYTEDSYGNAQETSVPTILIDNTYGGPNFHLVIQAREIGLLKQTGHRSSIKADIINKIYATGLLNAGNVLCRQAVEAETVSIAYCENGAIQDLKVNRLLLAAYAHGGATSLTDSNIETNLKTCQVINAFSVNLQDAPGYGLVGDACWVDGGATQRVNATYVAAAQNQGGRQIVNAGTVGSVRMSSSLLPSLGFVQSSHCLHVDVSARSELFMQTGFLFTVDVDSGGRARIRANQIGYDERLFDTLGFFDSSSVGTTGLSTLVDVANNDSDGTLPASYLEIIGARVVQKYYNSASPQAAVRHTAGHLVFRDCTVIAHDDADYSVRSTNYGNAGDQYDASLRYYGTNLSNKDGYRPLDEEDTPIPPNYGSLTVHAAIV